MKHPEELTAKEIAMRAIVGSIQVQGDGYVARNELENHITELIEQHTSEPLSRLLAQVSEREELFDAADEKAPELAALNGLRREELKAVKALIKQEVER